MKDKTSKLATVLLVLLFALPGLMLGCAGDDDDDDNGDNNVYTIQLNGGNGDNENGGDGGYVDMATYGIKGINIVPGRPNIKTSFTLPKQAEEYFGDVLLDVTSDMTIDVYADQPTAQAAVADGGYYMYLGLSRIWLRDSVGGDVQVTGLKVRKGKTLTLGLNFDRGGNTGQDTAVLDFNDDVWIAGTVTTKTLDTGDVGGAVVEARADGTNPGALEIDAWNIFIKGTVDLAGYDAAAGSDADGGDGGSINLEAEPGGVYFSGKIDISGGNGDGTGIGGNAGWQDDNSDTSYLESDEGVVVTKSPGKILLNGGDGSVGGEAGDLNIEAGYTWWNTANIFANGGNGSDGNGGDGGDLYFEARYGSIYFKARIEANGGDAVDGDAGDAYEVDFYPAYDEYMGEMSVAGRIEAKGGNASGTTGGDGGDGAGVEYYMYGAGEIRSTAAIIVDGGESTGTGFSGGDGGEFYIYKEEGYDEGYGSDYINPGDIIIAGKISANGGDGDYGGEGGYVDAECTYDPDLEAPDFGIFFYGYNAIEADGGDGGNNGGEGGYVDLYTEEAWTDFMDAYWQNGPIIDKTAFFGRGGNGSDGYGGDGGYYYAETDYETTDGNCKLVHPRNILLNGGDSAGTGSYGGEGGYVEVYAIDMVKIGGKIDISGGNGTGTNTDGGDADYVEIYSTYDILVNGNIFATGGEATGTGTAGDGGETLYIEAGARAIVNGNINISGGDADAASGFAGDGGEVEITSEWTGSKFSGKCTLDGGEAATDGYDGQLYIDGTFIKGYRT